MHRRIFGQLNAVQSAEHTVQKQLFQYNLHAGEYACILYQIMPDIMKRKKIRNKKSDYS